MKVSVLGAGAYGSALATILNENENSVTMWSAFEKEVNTLKETRIPKKLPGITLSDKITFTSNIEKALTDIDLIVIAIPTAFLSDVTKKMKPFYQGTPICIASKGIEQDSCLFVYDVVKNILNENKIAVISGPSFAIDVANNYPVGLTLACQDKETIDLTFKAFANSHFKLRKSYDIIGTEICGSIKNVIAIAAGMLSGMQMSESTKAMFITESLHDIKALIKGLGGDGNTVLSYAGFGDLLLTATSPKSRNYSFGYLIGKGATKEEINDYIKNNTIEGLYTLKSINQLVANKDVEMPIINLIDEIIYHGKSPKALINFLIEKP